MADQIQCEECGTYRPYEWLNGVGWCETKEHGMRQDDSCEEGKKRDEGKKRNRQA